RKSPVFGGRQDSDPAATMDSPIGQIPVAQGRGEGTHWGPIVKSGKRGEKLARKEHDLNPCKHYMQGRDERGNVFKRMHDGVSRKDPKLFMEVKAGRQGL